MPKFPIVCPKCGKKYILTTQDVRKLIPQNFNCPKCKGITPFTVILRGAPGMENIPMPPTPGPNMGPNMGPRPMGPGSMPPPRQQMPNGAPMKTQIGGADAPQTIPGAPHTHIAGADNANPLKTHIAGAVIGQQAHLAGAKAYIEVKDKGKKIALIPGIHILGRDSSDSTATLRIAADPYMSRQQAKLLVGTQGGKVLAKICPLKSNNAVYVNDKIVPFGSGVVLKNGDEILLGMTKVTYNEI